MPLHLPSLRRPEILGPSRRSRWRRWVLRRVAAVCCAVAAVLTLVGVVRPPAPPTTTVLVAARDLSSGAVLTAADLRAAEVTGDPGSTGTVGGTSRALDLVGRRLASGARAGEVLTSGRLIPRSPADGLPADTVAAHVLLADERSLDLVSAGLRVTLFADTGGEALARDVLVLGVDTPENPSLTGSLPGATVPPAGLVVALTPPALERIFAGQRPEGGPPKVLTVVTR